MELEDSEEGEDVDDEGFHVCINCMNHRYFITKCMLLISCYSFF